MSTSPRQLLLDAVVDRALTHGIADQSLRAIADGVRTSHRMLIHHFGSKEALLVAVTRAVEHRQQARFVEFGAAADADPRTTAWRFWQATSDPALHPQVRLFFEIYSQALQGREWALPLLDGELQRWVRPAAAALRAAGLPPARARALARLGVAATRGLLLDLLATGDVRGVDAAMRELLDLLE